MSSVVGQDATKIIIIIIIEIIIMIIIKKTTYCIIISTYSSVHKVYTATQNTKFVFGMKINDECFPFETGIQTNRGVIKIGKLYNMFERKQELPLILSFNEKNQAAAQQIILYRPMGSYLSFSRRSPALVLPQ